MRLSLTKAESGMSILYSMTMEHARTDLYKPSSGMACWSRISGICIGILVVCISNSAFYVSAQVDLRFIICGANAVYKDPNTTLDWQPDWLVSGITIDGGDNNRGAVKVDLPSLGLGGEYAALRYFPDQSKSEYCYYLPVTPNTPYFVRGGFLHGEYDNTTLSNTRILSLPITIDSVFLQTLYMTNSSHKYGFTFMLSTTRSTMAVCLGRTSQDLNPFISTLETKEFYKHMYPQCGEGRILTVAGRSDHGSSNQTRYPDDRWDRTWQPAPPDNRNQITYFNVTNTNMNPVYDDAAFPNGWNEPPVKTLQNGISSPLPFALNFNFGAYQQNLTHWENYIIYMYFLELDPTVNIGDRVFNISLNGVVVVPSMDILKVRGDRVHGLQILLNVTPGYNQGAKFFYSLQPTASSKLGPLLNGAEAFGVSDVMPRWVRPKSRVGTIVGAVVAGSLVVGLLLMLLWYRRRKRRAKYGPFHPPPRHKSVSGTEGFGDHGTYKEVKSYTYNEVVAMTKNWKEELGKGGFGTVYLGELPQDPKEGQEPQKVALKKLSTTSQQGHLEFLNEVDLLSRVHHSKLVCLVGYCEDSAQVLIYEYVEEGSLDLWLYGSRQGNPYFNWDRRLHIALDAALGLEYLHTGAKPTIIHRDVKSSNILLTKDWEGRVSDFGLSKTGSDTENKGHVSTMVKGTIGYLDPEYYGSAQLTNKSDVYSFGVVLLEIVTGRRPLDTTVPDPKHRTIGSYVALHYPNAIESVVDPRLNGKYNQESMCQIVDIAMRSLAVSSVDRPNMSEVVAEIRIAIKLETGKGTLSGQSSGVEGSGDKIGGQHAWGDAKGGLMSGLTLNNSSQWTSSTSTSTPHSVASVPDNASSVVFPR